MLSWPTAEYVFFTFVCKIAKKGDFNKKKLRIFIAKSWREMGLKLLSCLLIFLNRRLFLVANILVVTCRTASS
jgi:hypothetical protein